MKTTMCGTVFAASLVASAGVAMAETSADEVRAIVAEMLSDAETRSSLLQGGGSAGWDKGFFVESGDGAFTLKINGQIQFQFVGNSNDSMTDDYDHDFVNRRTKLIFSGTVYEDWGYKVNGAFGRSSGGTFALEDAYVTKKLNDDVKLTLGQHKARFLMEENVSSSRLLGAERSYTNEWFTIGRSQGASLSGGGDEWNWSVSFTDGASITSTSRNGEQSNSDLGTNNTDFALTGRVEFLFGEEGASWDQFKDFSSASDSVYAGRVGAAVNYQQGSDVGGGDEETSLGYTVDLALEFGGASLQAWFIGESIEDEAGASGVDSDQFAFGVQGGFHIVPDEWELFGRYEFIDFDDALGAGRDDSLNLITVGVVNYIHGHSVKWTNQITFAMDEVPSGTSSVALVTDTPGEDGQVGFISQIQLLF